MIFHQKHYPNLHGKYADKSSIKSFFSTLVSDNVLYLEFKKVWLYDLIRNLLFPGNTFPINYPGYLLYFLGYFRWTQLAVRMGQADLIIVDRSSANFLWDDNIIIFLRIENDKIFSIMKTFTKHVILKIHTFPRKMKFL